jgi:hypothetical protein
MFEHAPPPLLDVEEPDEPLDVEEPDEPLDVDEPDEPAELEEEPVFDVVEQAAHKMRDAVTTSFSIALPFVAGEGPNHHVTPFLFSAKPVPLFEPL